MKFRDVADVDNNMYLFKTSHLLCVVLFLGHVKNSNLLFTQLKNPAKKLLCIVEIDHNIPLLQMAILL